jgi:hypothetical protein
MEFEFLELRTRVRIGVRKGKLSWGCRMCSCRTRRVDLQVCSFGSSLELQDDDGL